MKIAVVTPYYREADDVLLACLDSVKQQSWESCMHILVADGFPNPAADREGVRHVKLPSAHEDNGNTARCIGGMLACAEGFDGIAFLDADNWYREDHIERMARLHLETGAQVCTSGRTIHRLDGSLMQIDHHPDESDGKRFIDTSCLCIFSGAFDLLPLWGTMPTGMGPICDRIMWQAIFDRRISRAHSPEPTVAFRSQYIHHYRLIGEKPPPGAKDDSAVNEAFEQFHRLPLTTRISLLQGPAIGDERGHAKGGSARRTSSVDLAVEGRKLAIAVPDDNRLRALLQDVVQRRIYSPPPGSPVPRCILDVGADVGIAAAYFRLVYPDAAIHCVEPDPLAYGLLASNARGIGNCATYRATLYDATCLWASHPARLEAESSPKARSLCIDAKSFVASLPADGIDLLKLDAGGAEPPIIWRLRDMLERIPVIHIAYRSERDRRLIDEMLTASHRLWRAADTPRRGLLTYILRGKGAA